MKDILKQEWKDLAIQAEYLKKQLLLVLQEYENNGCEVNVDIQGLEMNIKIVLPNGDNTK